MIIDRKENERGDVQTLKKNILKQRAKAMYTKKIKGGCRKKKNYQMVKWSARAVCITKFCRDLDFVEL